MKTLFSLLKTSIKEFQDYLVKVLLIYLDLMIDREMLEGHI